MRLIINTICLSILVLLEVIVYLNVSARLLPRILKIRYSVKTSRGRGLKKYVYPSGRGVSYEPAPTIRKYINRYLLFTDNGYKYLKCRLDEAVRDIEYTVVMFNAENKVIDLIDVKSKDITGGALAPVMIHGDTSYVEILLVSVNGKRLENEETTYYRLIDLLIYTLSSAVLGFIEILFAYNIVNLYFSWWQKGRTWADISSAYFIFPALVIGIICGAMAFLNARAKKIGWSK